MPGLLAQAVKRTLPPALLLFSISLVSAQVPALSNIYTFEGSPDGAIPETPLVRGPNGTLFGTTEIGGVYNNGAVFELMPPTVQGQPWTESIIYSFANGPGGYQPLGLTAGKDGILYGVTSFGGSGSGVVFSLTPPAVAGELWIESVLFTFPAGIYPATSVVIGQDGSLYAGTNASEAGSYGYFYQLSPPVNGSDAWTFAVLYAFTAQDICTFEGNGLTVGPNGVFYYTGRDLGPYVQAGGVGQLVPPSGEDSSWTDTILYTPRSGSVTSGSVVLAPSGQLYGTTYFGQISSGGSIFELTPPTNSGGAWTSKLIHQFTGSDGAEPSGLLRTSNGDLIGVTKYGSTFYTAGAIFILLAPSTAGGEWIARILHNFAYRGSGSVGPVGPFVAGPGESLYGVTSSGGPGTYGTAFQLVR